MIRALCLFLFFLFCMNAFANGSTGSKAFGRHIQVASYNPNAIYKVNTMQGFITTIQFGEREEILSVNLGDSSSWLVNVQNNVINIKPIVDDPDTNMNVLTSRGTYQFFLTAPPLSLDSEGKISRQPQYDTVFLLRFKYPQEKNTYQEAQPRRRAFVENWHYTAKGDAETAPLSVCDDDTFTFFDFGDKKAIPAIFKVDDNGNESIVNYHLSGKIVVVETTGKQFTLRNGNKVATVFNEAAG